jgi:hypothetical protein
VDRRRPANPGDHDCRRAGRQRHDRIYCGRAIIYVRSRKPGADSFNDLFALAHLFRSDSDREPRGHRTGTSDRPERRRIRQTASHQLELHSAAAPLQPYTPATPTKPAISASARRPASPRPQPAGQGNCRAIRPAPRSPSQPRSQRHLAAARRRQPAETVGAVRDRSMRERRPLSRSTAPPEEPGCIWMVKQRAKAGGFADATVHHRGARQHAGVHVHQPPARRVVPLPHNNGERHPTVLKATDAVEAAAAVASPSRSKATPTKTRSPARTRLSPAPSETPPVPRRQARRLALL